MGYDTIFTETTRLLLPSVLARPLCWCQTDYFNVSKHCFMPFSVHIFMCVCTLYIIALLWAAYSRIKTTIIQITEKSTEKTVIEKRRRREWQTEGCKIWNQHTSKIWMASLSNKCQTNTIPPLPLGFVKPARGHSLSLQSCILCPWSCQYNYS